VSITFCKTSLTIGPYSFLQMALPLCKVSCALFDSKQPGFPMSFSRITLETIGNKTSHCTLFCLTWLKLWTIGTNKCLVIFFSKKKKLWARLEGIQKKFPYEQNRFLLKLETQLRKELNEVLDQIETFWFQKSRMEALRDGDKNTRFYHLYTIVRRKNNKIDLLQSSTRKLGDRSEYVAGYGASFLC